MAIVLEERALARDYCDVENNPSPMRWWVLATVLLGTLVGTINNSIANVGLPSILDEFNHPVSSGVWVITGYVLGFAVFMPVFGRLGDMFGQRRMYILCLIGYLVMAVPCSLAPSLETLVAFRALQGVAVGAVLPSVMSIIAATFPTRERGRAMGFWATVNGLGLSIGPPVGGFLTSALGWRSIFWAPVPVALIGLVLAIKMVPFDEPRPRQRFDVVGAAVLVATIVCLMISVSVTGEQGLGSWATIGLWLGTAGLLVLFVCAERRIKPPFVDLGLFRIGPYVAATLSAAVQVLCLGGTQLLIPLFVVRALELDISTAGVLLFFMPITMMLMASPAGQINDRYGSRVPAVTGLLLIAAAAGLLALQRAPVGLPGIGACLVLMGVGIALVQSPSAAAVTYVIEPERMGVAVGFFNMFRFVGSAFGATMFGIALHAFTLSGTVSGQSASDAQATAFQWDFALMAVIALVSVLAALRMASRKPAPRVKC